MTEGREDAREELRRVKHQLGAMEQLFEVYERTTLEQAGRLEQVAEERARVERHLAAEYETALALAESATVPEAMQRILRAMCEILSWEHASFWMVDREAQVLRAVETWHSPHFELEEFDKITRASTFPPGIGLPGRVWATRQPAWIPDVTQDANFPRALAASRVGLHGAFALPILLSTEVRGIIELFSREIRQPDDALSRVLTSIGNQIGQVAERRRTEKALEESQERTRLMIQVALDAVITMTEDGAITGWNAEAERTFGWFSSETIGRRLSDTIIPVKHRAAHEKGLRHFLATGEGPVLSKRIEITALHRDGREFPVELAITPLKVGGSWAFSAFVRDITGRKRAEAALQQAKEAAEAASCAKSEFLANMSHEIRTPMNGIIGMTELTLETQLSAEQREYLEMVKMSADSLMSLINDILDFSKIEAGKLEFERIDFSLRDNLEATVRGFRAEARRKGLQLVCNIGSDVPEVVVGDPTRLRQVVVNLLGNAIKFTERGEIVLQVERDRPEEGGRSLHFATRDTGIGIAKDKQKLIFDAFAQADGSSTRKYGGTGLGLTISSRLVQLMGGRIWVESEPGKGSAFHFTARFDVDGDRHALLGGLTR